jgi:hypothetical protein
MKALGWDDKPRDYFNRLKTSLGRLEITLEIEPSVDRFIERFHTEEWDLIVTDLVDESSSEGDENQTGLEIARRISVAAAAARKNLPVFIVTNYTDRLNPAAAGLGRNVIIKSKNLSAAWMAGEIRQDLEDRGLFVDHKRVFLIYGHDKQAPQSRDKVKQFLSDRQVEVSEITPGSLSINLLDGLLDRMRNCAAILALCTPDDRTDESRLPRPNVLLEIGIAVGLANGPQRLILLQHAQASLPTDLDGILTLRFNRSVDEVLPDLEKRLKRLHVSL